VPSELEEKKSQFKEVGPIAKKKLPRTKPIGQNKQPRFAGKGFNEKGGRAKKRETSKWGSGKNPKKLSTTPTTRVKQTGRTYRASCSKSEISFPIRGEGKEVKKERSALRAKNGAPARTGALPSKKGRSLALRSVGQAHLPLRGPISTGKNNGKREDEYGNPTNSSKERGQLKLKTSSAPGGEKRTTAKSPSLREKKKVLRRNRRLSPGQSPRGGGQKEPSQTDDVFASNIFK